MGKPCKIRILGTGSQRAPESAGSGGILDAFHHGPQPITTGGAEMLHQVQGIKIRLYIEGKDFTRRLAVISSQHHTEQPFYDESITVCREAQTPVLHFTRQPNLTLAAAHQIGFSAIFLGQRR